MSHIFEKFIGFDLGEIREEADYVLNPTPKDRQFDDPVSGTYECRVEKMMLGQSKKGTPLFKCQFKILVGQYEGSMIYMNQILSPSAHCTVGQRIGLVNKFLKSLESGIEVEFKDFVQWEKMISEIADDIDDRLEYEIYYSKSKSGCQQFNIIQVYDKF